MAETNKSKPQTKPSKPSVSRNLDTKAAYIGATNVQTTKQKQSNRSEQGRAKEPANEKLSDKLKADFCEKYQDGKKALNDAKHELLDETIVEKAIDFIRKYEEKLELKKKRRSLISECEYSEDGDLATNFQGVQPCYYTNEDICKFCDEAQITNINFLEASSKASGALRALRNAVERKEKA